MMLGKDSFKDMFIFETNDLIRQLEEIIMENESSGSFAQDSVAAVFRIMHTIKGSASMMGFQSISDLAHAIEDLFEYIRSNHALAQDPKVMDMILESLDFIRGEADKINENKPADGDSSVFTAKARNMLAAFQSSDHVTEAEHVAPEQEIVAPEAGEDPDAGFAPEMIYQVTVFYEEGCGMESLRAFMLIKDMEDFAYDICHLPEDISDESCEEEIRTKGFRVFFNSDKNDEELSEFLNEIVFLEKVTLVKRKEPEKGETEAPIQTTKELEQTPYECETGGEQAEATRAKSARSVMISVGVEKLDTLMNLVGELMISGMMVSEELLSGIQEEEIQSRREALCCQHGKTIADLQDIAMLLRMVPVSVTFHKMRRVVRDMCRKLGKDVNIQMIGEETEIDKNVLDSISDPLLHLVRNAVDHGIGTEEERLAAGKPRQGNIVLEARNAGSDVLIFVRDDGHGLDRGKIYKKAHQKGLVSKQENEMTDTEVFSYIFKPGFSTSENVTEFSGRGVGLDVVTQNVTQIGGNILVESTPGEGSTFIIRIPITLAIIGGMIFEVADNKYVLPISVIKECVEVTEEDLILDPQGNEAVLIREECYPVLRLHKRYHIDNGITSISDGVLIVIDTEYVKYCLFVDHLIGERQVVVKSLPKWIDKKIKGVSGCTLLGDGSISLILEAATLIE